MCIIQAIKEEEEGDDDVIMMWWLRRGTQRQWRQRRKPQHWIVHEQGQGLH